MYTRKHNTKYFEMIDTEEKAYWLGFLYADGSLYKCKPNEGYRFELSLQTIDLKHIEKFAKAIDCDTKISLKTIKAKNKTYYAYRLCFYCNEFAEILIKQGCTTNVNPHNLRG